MVKDDGKIHVLHVIPSLMQGGIETVLSNIIRHSDSTKVSHHLLVLGDNKSFSHEFDELPVQIHYLPEMRPKEQLDLARKIDIVHITHRKTAFMATPFVKFLNKPLVLGVHISFGERDDDGATLKEAIYQKVEPHIARQADKVICCAKNVHQRVSSRLASGRAEIIQNGIDPEHFSRDEAEGRKIRAELHIPEDAAVIGISARYAPMKDIPNFIESARLIKARHPEKPIVFMICGSRMNEDNVSLVEQLKKAGIYEQTRLLGVRFDMHKIYSSMDVLTLTSSKREALSMALLEGTACGCYCVSTDVGDHRDLMKKTGGICVPVRNSEAIANAIDDFLKMDKKALKEKQQHARAVIEEYYHVKDMATKYEQLFMETVSMHKSKSIFNR